MQSTLSHPPSHPPPLSPPPPPVLCSALPGLLGICGHSDLRTVIDMAAAGDKVGQLALNMFVYRVRKYIGAYTAALDVSTWGHHHHSVPTTHHTPHTLHPHPHLLTSS